ncbi:MAG: rhodanese-like domain-containing protein [Bacteroidetes bacterium]|nr:rhodanese-like domain-containing protein [Bacteroidota bacterium]
MKAQKKVLLEITVIIAAAAVFGFVYTFITNQGFFAEKDGHDTSTGSNLEMISLENAKELFDSQEALFIDSRHNFDYNRGHIHGAINIGLDSIKTAGAVLETIPKEKIFVIYCDGVECNSSIELAAELNGLNFKNIKIFFGGWQEWKKNNYPIDYQ